MNEKNLEDLFNFFEEGKVTIIPAPEKDGIRGTSGLFFSINVWNKSFQLKFGQNSFNKFKKMFEAMNVDWKVYDDVFGFDLDDKDDLIELNTLNIGQTVIKRQVNEILSLII
jgi:2-phospho-L-lactate guanylyltransferase (CobY/MobA/RfbA family)